MLKLKHIVVAHYKLDGGEAGVDHMQLLDVLIPDTDLFQITILAKLIAK